MRQFRAAFLAALFPLLTGFAAFADDVTLSSRDGALEIPGTLLTFDGEFYRVDTRYGVLTFDASEVNCRGAGCPNLGNFIAEFTLSGSAIMGEVLLPALIEGFSLNHGYTVKRETQPEESDLFRLFEREGAREAARITVRKTSSAEGFADLLVERADLVLSLREATSQERDMVREAGLGDLFGSRQFRVLARDGIVPIVAPGNPVDSMTIAQLAKVFSGEITHWNELGGEPAPITLHLTEANTGFGQRFFSEVLEPRNAMLSDAAVIHETPQELTRAVLSDPFGIGITGYSQSGLADVVTLTGSCAFKVSASTDSIRSGDYPLTAPLFLYLPARRLPKLARDFLSYLRSNSAQYVIRRAGFVDQNFAEESLSSQGIRLANAIIAAGKEVDLAELQRMTELLSSTNRLSLTFRFMGGATVLDAASQSNQILLAAALESGRFDGRKLTFVGFSDGVGAADQNRNLSRRRAKAVEAGVLGETEVFDPGKVEIATDGFGEALPMACDDSVWGREINRRVEIWIR